MCAIELISSNKNTQFSTEKTSGTYGISIAALCYSKIASQSKTILLNAFRSGSLQKTPVLTRYASYDKTLVMKIDVAPGGKSFPS